MIDCRVLVVDDDKDTREVLVDLLRDEGYEARGAADGKEALAVLAAGEFKADVILLDLYMPTMSGKDLRAALQADPRYAHIPVVLCTGAAALAGVDSEPFAQLQKPIDIDALLAVVGRGCGASKRGERALSA